VSRYDPYDSPSLDQSLPVRAHVKWFNTTKGFGFVSPVDGTPDAFLHMSVVSRAGLHDVAEGAEMLVTIGPGPKGPQVLRVLEVTGGGAPRPPRPPRDNPRDRAQGPTTDLSGTVKWFKTDKGFGFVVADDGGKDVFVHKTVLRRCNLPDVETGQRLQMRVVEAERGREAVWVDLL